MSKALDQIGRESLSIDEQVWLAVAENHERKLVSLGSTAVVPLCNLLDRLYKAVDPGLRQHPGCGGPAGHGPEAFIVVALGKIGDPRAVRAVARNLQGARSLESHLFCFGALRSIGGSEAVGVLAEHIRGSWRYTREAQAAIVSMIDPERLNNEILENLASLPDGSYFETYVDGPPAKRTVDCSKIRNLAAEELSRRNRDDYSARPEILRLTESRLLSEFVREKKANWGHEDWLGLIARVRDAGYRTLSDAEVGGALEGERTRFISGEAAR